LAHGCIWQSPASELEASCQGVPFKEEYAKLLGASILATIDVGYCWMMLGVGNGSPQRQRNISLLCHVQHVSLKKSNQDS